MYMTLIELETSSLMLKYNPIPIVNSAW